MNNNEVVKKIDSERGRVVKELRKKMNQTKFDLLKQYFINEKIDIPEKVETVEQLMIFARKKLSKEQYEVVKKKKKNIEKDIDVMVDDLSKGSTTAFSVKFKSLMENVKGVGLAVLEPIALAAVLNIITPPPLKIFSSAAILGRSGYKLVKSYKKRKIANESYGLSKIIRELEVKKDSNGKIIDTRFSLSMQEKIREFFKEKKVEFEDTGYISLISTIYSLDLDSKRELCHFINNNLGNSIDIDKELKKYKNSFFDFSAVSYMTGVGLTFSNTINNMPIVQKSLSTLITGLSSGIATDNAVIGMVSGVGKGSLNVIADVFNIDSLKNVLQTYDTAINTVTITAGFAALGVAGAVGASLWHYIRGKKLRYDNTLENQEISKLDKELYAKEIELEQEKIRKNLIEHPKIVDVMIGSLVYEYMQKKGIEIPEEIKDANQLAEFIKTLNLNQRNDINKFYEQLKYYNKHNHSEFMRKTGKFFDTIKDVATVGLAGLSLYDLFIDHEFLEKMNETFTSKVSDTFDSLKKVEPVVEQNIEPVVEQNIETVVEQPNIESNTRVIINTEEQYNDAKISVDDFYDPKIYDNSMGWSNHLPDLKIDNPEVIIRCDELNGSVQGLDSNDIYSLFSRISANEIMDSDVKIDTMNKFLFSLDTREFNDFVDFYNYVSNNGSFTMPNSSEVYYWPSNFPAHTQIGEILTNVVKARPDTLGMQGVVNVAVENFNEKGEILSNQVDEIAGRKIGIITPAAAIDSFANLNTLKTEKDSKKSKTSFERKKDFLEDVKRRLSNVPITQTIQDNSIEPIQDSSIKMGEDLSNTTSRTM